MTTSEPLWFDPVVEDLGRGVFRIPLPLPNDGLRAVNVYAVCDSEGVVLIDGGWAFAEGEVQLNRSLRSLGRDISEVGRILVTHVHRDHYTQAVVIRERHGSRVGLGDGEKANLAAIQGSFGQSRVPSNVDVLVRAGAGELVEQMSTMSAHDQRTWTDPDEWLQDGEVLSVGPLTLRAIATPGHTAGHLVYREDDLAMLFAGDHVLPHITPSIGFEPAPVRWPLRDYLDSLALMSSAPDALLLPAHGPVADSVHARVAQLLEHHAHRLDESYAVVRAGACTSYETASIMLWTRRRRPFDSLDPFNQRLAVAETAAHLDVLVLQGRLSADTIDSVERYVAN